MAKRGQASRFNENLQVFPRLRKFADTGNGRRAKPLAELAENAEKNYLLELLCALCELCVRTPPAQKTWQTGKLIFFRHASPYVRGSSV